MSSGKRVPIAFVFRAAAGIATAVALAAGGAAPGHAADTGGSSSMGPSSRVEDPGYAGGAKAIKAGNYAAAIPLLEGAVERDKGNADALNLLAYATRKTAMRPSPFRSTSGRSPSTRSTAAPTSTSARRTSRSATCRRPRSTSRGWTSSAPSAARSTAT